MPSCIKLKSVFHILRYNFFIVIMCYIIYFIGSLLQTQSSFFIQALRMDVRIQNINIPAAMLSTFTNLSIVIIIPVLDRVIYPCMSKLGFPMTLLKRIGNYQNILYNYFFSFGAKASKAAYYTETVVVSSCHLKLQQARLFGNSKQL